MTQTVNRDAVPGGVPGGTTTPDTNPAADAWTTVTGWLDTVPGWAWLALSAGLFIALVVMRIRLERTIRANRATGKTTKLGGLFATAVAFAAALWAAVLLGSGKNLTGWARDTLGWTDGWDLLVPATLDGVAIAFAVLMFAAVRAGRPANRSARVVGIATAVSALIGFSHEYDGSIKSTFAALYLGFLALGAMAILHELLDLFRSHTTTTVIRVKPVFGLRWVTYAPNTLCAALAWQNHPPRPLPANAPADQIAWYGSVRHAVAHLEVVRRAKRVRRFAVDRYAGAAPAAGWARVLPWLRVRELTAALVDLREQMTATVEQVRADAAAELASVVDQAAAARDQAANTIADLTRQLTDMTALFEQATEDTRTADARTADAEQRATTADVARRQAEATADSTRLEAARVEQRVVDLTARVRQLDADLAAAREETGALRGQVTDATADAADARRRLADEQAARQADVDRLTRERQDAVSRVLTDTARQGRQPAGSRRERPAALPVDEAADKPNTGGGKQPAGGSRAGEPSSPPWSARQTEAFALRDGDPKTWSWPKLAARYGVSSSAMRRWFDNRAKHQDTPATSPAVPTVSIVQPKTPVTSGVNGAPYTH